MSHKTLRKAIEQLEADFRDTARAVRMNTDYEPVCRASYCFRTAEDLKRTLAENPPGPKMWVVSVPFANKKDAERFAEAHQGTVVVYGPEDS
jgi:hypothetical protein